MSCKLLQLQGSKMLIQVCTRTLGLQCFAAILPFPSPIRAVFKFPFLTTIRKEKKTACYFLIGIHTEGGEAWSLSVCRE